MFPKFSPAIVERLSEPVIALGGRGEILDFNSTARPLLRHFVMNHGDIRRDLAVAADSKSGLPRVLASMPCLDVAGVQREAWLCECGDGLAVIFLPKANLVSRVRSTQESPDCSAAFYSLLNAEVRQEFADVRDRLSAFVSSHPSECTELVQPVLRLGRLLSVLELLATMLQSPVAEHMERLSLQDLVRDVLARTPGLHSGCLNDTLSDDVQRHGAVYGRPEWLRAALQALLDALLETASLEQNVELRLRQNGNFLVLTGSHRAAVGQVSGRRNAADQSAASDVIPVLRTDAGIRLAVARLIVDFHGGMLRLNRPLHAPEVAGLLDAFTLELPTGMAHQECSAAARAKCIYPAQARALAQDLAQILPKGAADSVLSSGEVSLLNEIMRGLAQR